MELQVDDPVREVPRVVPVLPRLEGGKLVSTGAGDQALVIALAYKDANLGLVLMALQRASRKVDEILRRAETR